MTLVGCVEHLEDYSVTSQKKITFQTAKYQTTRAVEEQINGSKFTYDHFVTHAWSAAVVNADKVFMNHQKVTKNDNANTWMPTVDYYWPNYSTVDFISYYPEQAETGEEKSCPKVESEKLTYTGYDVSGEKAALNTPANDLMYAEKAVGYSGNIDRVNDDNGGTNDSGYSGVPTLFHHALAQLEIRVLVKHPEGETESHWEAVIDHAKLDGYYTQGDLELELNDPSLMHGVTGWTPKGAENVGWTLSDDVAATSLQLVGTGSENEILTVSSTGSGEGYVEGETRGGSKSLLNVFVLPQTLTDKHFFDLKFTLNKYRGTTLETSEADTEVRHIQLKTDIIPYWGMNQRILYTIIINPAKNGKVMFDPAVVDWEDVTGNKDADDYQKEGEYFRIPTDAQWQKSNVWYAVKGEKKFAEIAKEAVYTLSSPRKYYQVVSVYPVKDGVTDLSKGVIAQVLRAEDGSDVANMAGGKIAMRYPNDAYANGNKAIANISIPGGEANHEHVVVDKEGNFSFEEPGVLYTELPIEAYTVSDKNNNVYPVVKIGATYWTRENLRVTQYNDGTALSSKHESTSFVAGKECVYVTEKDPMYSWYSNGVFDVSVQGDDVKKRYGLLYNHRAICGAEDPWTTQRPNVYIMQQGDPYLADNADFTNEPNKQLAPTGWHIPTINVYPQFREGVADVDYITEFVNEDWRRMMTNNIATSAIRDLATAQWPKHPQNTSFSNITDLSLDATLALGQTDTNAFDPMAPNYSGETTLKGLIFFWTSSLVYNIDDAYFYPGFMPCTSYQDTKIEVWFMDNKAYNKMLAHQYLPVRCVRN